MESVQRGATKCVPQLKDLPYEERQQKLNLPTLTYRRSRGDMIEVYKTLSGEYDDCCNDKSQLRDEGLTRGNSEKIYKTRARVNVRKYAFASRAVDNWNGLPKWVINSVTVERFERNLQ